MNKPPRNFCIMPFTSMTVRVDGSVSACCENSQCAQSADGEKLHLYKDRVRDAFHGPFFTELRRSMLAGERHPSCGSCWAADDAGLLSKRMHENETFREELEKVMAGEVPVQPVDLSLNLGNQCNLKCRICGPVSSSRWAAEYLSLYGQDHVPRQNRIMKELDPEAGRSLITNWPYRDANFTGDLFGWLEHVKRFEFLGGEPFLNKKQFEIVKECAERGYASKQKIIFVTNGTTFPGEEALAHWKKFRKVNVNISVDGVGPQFEYQRYGASWNEVTAHIAKYRALPQVTAVNLMVTASIFNVYYLPEIYAYWASQGIEVTNCEVPDEEPAAKPAATPPGMFARLKELVKGPERAQKQNGWLYTSYVFNPDRFDIRVLPPALKQAVVKKFREFPGTLPKFARAQLDAVTAQLLSEDRSHLWLRTIENVWFHDGYRKQTFADTFPEFHAEAVRLGVWFDYEKQRDVFFPEKATSAQPAT